MRFLLALLLLSPLLHAQANTPCPQPAPPAGTQAQPDPMLWRPMMRAATDLLRKGDYEAAVTQAIQGAAQIPPSSMAYDALGLIQYKVNHMELAVEAYQRSLELNPCNAYPHYHLSRLYRYLGHHDLAQQELELAYQLRPSDSRIADQWMASQQLLTDPVAPQPAAEKPFVEVTSPPHFNFFFKLVNCDGIPIRSSAIVNDSALLAACDTMRLELSHMPDARKNLIARKSEVHIIAQDELLSDLPQDRDRRAVEFTDNLGKTTNLDIRGRGEGGVYTVCSEENLLHLPGDPYGTYNVCLHEFAHDIMNSGLSPAMHDDIAKQYKASLANGLWKGSYAATDIYEFWAELSMMYFGAPSGKFPGQPEAGPSGLQKYDPDAFALLDSIYSGRKQPPVVMFANARNLSLGSVSPGNGISSELLVMNNTKRRFYVFWSRQTQSSGWVSPYALSDWPSTTDQILTLRDETGKITIRFQATTPHALCVIEDKDLK